HGFSWESMGICWNLWTTPGSTSRRAGWSSRQKGKGRTPLRRARYLADGAGRLFVQRHWLGRLGQSRPTAQPSAAEATMWGRRAPPASIGGPARAHGSRDVSGGAKKARRRERSARVGTKTYHLVDS